tara:strand:+ start:1682 stop:2164 length:483 start_codon:yes stop_codon:yes gene_type:complete
MLSILSGILGFATSGLPSVLSFFQQKGDQKHEQEMAKLEMDRAIALAEKGFASQERVEAFKTDQVEMQTYSEERTNLYNHDIEIGKGASQWVINLRSSVRPIVTYAFVLILLVVDIGGLIWAIHIGADFHEAMKTVFDTEEQAIFASIIGFWFGSRHWEK